MINKLYLCIVNKQKQHTNIVKMRRIRTAPSLPKMLRALQEGEAVKVLAADCKETALRVVATRLKKEGYCYRVNALKGYCIVTRTA